MAITLVRVRVSVRVWQFLVLVRIDEQKLLIYGDIAQMGERLPCKQEVAGSIPTISTSSMGSHGG